MPFLTKGKRYRLSGITDEPIEFIAGDAVTIVQIDKGTCPKCGGSRVVDHPSCGTVPCPACDGTGECRHKNIVESLPGMLYCRDCQQYLENRRSGEERRIRTSRTYWCRPTNFERHVAEVKHYSLGKTGVHPSLEYLDHIRSLPCLGPVEEGSYRGCKREAEPHHLRAVGMGNNRKKPSVQHYTAIPLCREHHLHIKALGWRECELRWKVHLWHWAFRNYLRWLEDGHGWTP